MKLLLVIPLLVALGGCVTSPVSPIVNKYTVIIAPDSLYNCPVVTQWPVIKTLTDLETARLIVQLAQNNKICKSSMVALKTFYENAKKKFEN